MNTIITVPARLESKRLPNKVLADINGKPMIQMVLERCKRSKLANSLFLCTDSKELLKLSQKWGVNAIETSSACESGTERISTIVKDICGNDSLDKTLIINVQGDQPFIDPTVIDKMIVHFKNIIPLPSVMTPVYKLSKESIHNPNIVKTILSKSKKAIYFSRSALPHVREVSEKNWHKYHDYWGHVGIYGYRADVILNWPDLGSSTLEKVEKLEQLRFIDSGINIETFEVKGDFLSVDTEAQLIEANHIAQSQIDI